MDAIDGRRQRACRDLAMPGAGAIADFGGAEVYTLARTGWPQMCPNAATLFKNLTFEIGMENTLMGSILDGEDPKAAATAWLKANPKAIEPWLSGVTTLDGKPGADAVKVSLGL